MFLSNVSGCCVCYCYRKAVSSAPEYSSLSGVQREDLEDRLNSLVDKQKLVVSL